MKRRGWRRPGRPTQINRNPGGVSDRPTVFPHLRACLALVTEADTARDEDALRSTAAVVNFNEAVASAVVHSREQRGVKTRRERRHYARLQWV